MSTPGKQLAPGRERFFAEIFTLEREKIEDVIDQRHALLGAFVNLKQLKGRSAFLIEGGNFAN